MNRMSARDFWRVVETVLPVLAATGCATLPDADAVIARHARQAARFENVPGPLSKQSKAKQISAAILAQLKKKSGDIDIPEKQIGLDQAIVGSPLIVGNQVTPLQDGPATYAAKFAAIRRAQNHINLDFYIIEDDVIGHQFADLLLAQQSRGVQVNRMLDVFTSDLAESQEIDLQSWQRRPVSSRLKEWGALWWRRLL